MIDSRRETAFIDTFIVRAKWDRYKSLMANRARRPKILDLLNHNLDCDAAYAQAVEGEAGASSLLS